MNSMISKFYTFFIFVAGQAGLFLLLLVTHVDSFNIVSIEPDIIWIRTMALIVGVSILGFILFKFSAKYRLNPTMGRFNVLIGVISFVIATGTYLFSTSLEFNSTLLDRLVQDVSNIFLILALNLFNVFGIYFLLASSDQAKGERIKKGLDVALISLYTTYIVAKTSLFLGWDASFVGTMQDIGEIAVVLFGFVSLVFLLVIAIKALNIAKRTTDAGYKAGLRALGISYSVLFAGTFTLILNGLEIDDSKFMIIVAVMLLVVAFYFIYAGFVKPSSTNKS
jgi:hypothetical protein